MKTRDGISEFICDGLFNLEMNAIGEEINRTIHFVKLRMTNIGSAMKNFELTNQGIVVR
jgi:KaiC/GvpD/RAD55 family RecA-like ATPase